MTIAKRIREIREAKGIKSKHVAESLNKSPAWVSSVENGKTRLPADLIKPLADVLGVPVSSFFEENVFESKTSKVNKKTATA